MTATDREKLKKIEEYIDSIFPIFRPAVLESPEREGYKAGYDQAAYTIQQEVWRILDV